VAQSKLKARQRRRERIRKTVHGTATKPRLSVYKSLSHIYAQLIDDTTGTTLIAAASTEKAVQEGLKHCGNVVAAKGRQRIGYQLMLVGMWFGAAGLPKAVVPLWQLAQPVLMPVWFIAAPPLKLVVDLWQVSQAALVTI